MDIQTIALPEGNAVNLSTVNYPQKTYSDRKWIVTNNNKGSLMLRFVDFNISFGSSLTIGSGIDFNNDHELIKFGSPDIHVLVDDILTFTDSVICIWYQANDPSSKLISHMDYYLYYFDLETIDSYPSTNAIKIQLERKNDGNIFN